MAPTTKTGRRRPTALRPTAAGMCAAAVLALTLSGCSGHDGGSATPSAEPSSAAADASGGATAASAKPAAKPAAKSSAGTGGGSTATGATPAASASSATGTPAAAGSGGKDDGCDHKMPISPDEIAVYRYTPEGGSLSLIVKHGNWGCPTADSDGAPFVTVGKETYLPMDQAAYVTATNPIVESSENQRIGVQELLDWLEAHPNSGLVFKYHLGGNGAIDSLEEVFTP
ncbi:MULTISPECIES: hypothetical protein [Streptomyces]|uniref:hypothetical protein n=1 Tax=Streptomyces TaxID=1883 RepID=UPI00292D176D|nr:hypothetical protein [Streptomyces sp. NEAU-HV9]